MGFCNYQTTPFHIHQWSPIIFALYATQFMGSVSPLTLYWARSLLLSSYLPDNAWKTSKVLLARRLISCGCSSTMQTLTQMSFPRHHIQISGAWRLFSQPHLVCRSCPHTLGEAVHIANQTGAMFCQSQDMPLSTSAIASLWWRMGFSKALFTVWERLLDAKCRKDTA